MVYDCFTFFNELDLLEIRLNVLNDVVDKFVIVEATKKHSGGDKPLYFDINRNRYSDFNNKIIYITVNDLPQYNGNSWIYENLQRNCIIRGLNDCKDDDIIIISDLDEIPDPQKIKRYKNFPGIKTFEQKMFYYYINYWNVTAPKWKSGSKMLSFRDCLHSLDNVNDIYTRSLIAEYNQGTTPTKIRLYNGGFVIRNGGWHFSYCGGAEMILNKIQSFSHQEYNIKDYANIEEIKENINKGRDIFNRGFYFEAVKIDESYPEYIRKNLSKYDKLIIEVPGTNRICLLIRRIYHIVAFWGKKVTRKIDSLINKRK